MCRPSRDHATWPSIRCRPRRAGPASARPSRCPRNRSRREVSWDDRPGSAPPAGLLRPSIGPGARRASPPGIRVGIHPVVVRAVRPVDLPQHLAVRQTPDGDRGPDVGAGPHDEPGPVGRERQAVDPRSRLDQVPVRGIRRRLRAFPAGSRRRAASSRTLRRCTTPSPPPLAIMRPSGENATALTVCPWSLPRCKQPIARQVPQHEMPVESPQASLVPSGEKAKQPGDEAGRIRDVDSLDRPAGLDVEQRDLRGGIVSLRGGDQLTIGRECELVDVPSRPQVVRADSRQGAGGRGARSVSSARSGPVAAPPTITATMARKARRIRGSPLATLLNSPCMASSSSRLSAHHRPDDRRRSRNP